jgi:hypothetical protein
MNVFQKISLLNRFSKAIKKVKKLIDEKQGLAEKARAQIENIEVGFKGLAELCPELRNIIAEIRLIIEDIK